MFLLPDGTLIACCMFTVSGLNDSSVYMDSEDVLPSNPFMKTKQENSVLDIALGILGTVTARNGPRKYDLYLSIWFGPILL